MARKIPLEDLLPSKIPLESGQMNLEVFTRYVRVQKAEMAEKGTLLEKICSEEYDELSKQLDISQVQASPSVRNVLFTRRLSNVLITDEGALNLEVLDEAIRLIRKNLYSLGSNRQYDASRHEHILKILTEIRDNKKLQGKIKRFDKPYSNQVADQIIRDTMQLPAKTVVTDAHAKRALLSAMLCYLRQSVGSCFATAPAIIVHDEQPMQFVNDIAELLSTGRMKRTFAGEEFSAPMSLSWGAGDLRRRIPFAKNLEEATPLWRSPGLINALQAVDILSKEDPLSKRRELLQELIVKAVAFGGYVGERFYISVEELIELILLQHHDLTPDDLSEYLNRPSEMVHGGMMMHVSKKGFGKGGVGQRCAQFLQDNTQAGNAFKALADNALLKSWEFTLATFTETKAKFSSWNLYISLGLRPDDKGGIAECMLNEIQQRLDQENLKIEELQTEYEQVYAQVKYLEGRIKRASEDEARWLRAEYQSRVNEFRTIEEIRGKASYRAQSFANLFDVMIDKYLKLFPQYFQEVYDADMHHISVGAYDDSPAGFQLIYKYGRVATTAWTPVKNLHDFVEVLTAFFSTTEHEFAHDDTFEGFQNDISQIITSIIGWVKTEEFLETAFYRMAAAKGARVPKKPLEHLDQVEKKPWAYTSGGSLDTLLSCYFKREERPTHQDRWVENPTELLVFFIDIMKETPSEIIEKFRENPKRNMLMVSPTHAFNFKPGFPVLQEGWKSDEYTYIWCRDQLLIPMKTFVDRISLDSSMIEFLIDRLCESLPQAFHHFFRKAFAYPPKRAGTPDFRDYVIKILSYDSQLTPVEKYYLNSDAIDSFLYEHLPLFHSYQLKERVHDIFQEIPEIDDQRHSAVMELFDEIKDRFQYQDVISAKALRELCKSLATIMIEKTSDEVDWLRGIHFAAQKLGYSMPRPVIFADTNWVTDMFGFVVNPGTGEVELWRLDETGIHGAPMSIWTRWLDGSHHDPKWGIYPRPHEYKL